MTRHNTARANLEHVILPEAEIRDLVRRHRAGDKSAAMTIIEHNERAIHRIARSYLATGVCGNAELDDLMQLGRMGMLRALETFDLESGNKFLSYAWHWVRMYISRHGRMDGSPVSMSYRAHEQRAVVGAARAAFVQEFGRQPSLDELKALTGWSHAKLATLRTSVVSLDQPKAGGDGNLNGTIGDFIPDDNAEDPERTAEQKQLVEAIYRHMEGMPPRWRLLLAHYYGLDGVERLTLKEIAGKMRVTRQRASEILNESLTKLRKEIAR